MGAEPHHLHVVMFPFLAHGHMIPVLDIAKLFVARNVKATIITTPVNAPTFSKAVETGHKLGNTLLNLEIFKFPTQEAGLPEGFENAEQVIRQPELTAQFVHAAQMMQEQLERYLDMARPDCLIADMFYPWATDTAAKFNIPSVVFHGTSYFALCAQEIIRLYEPYKKASSDDESFVLPRMPNDIEFVRSQIPEDLRDVEDNPHKKRMELIKKSEMISFGVIVNSFYELEPDYEKFYKEDLGRRAWHVGPVSLCNRSIQEKAQRGKQAAIDEHECLTWLQSKKAGSVIYICFGSTSHSIAPQLHEIAVALESSGKNFIWVQRNSENEEWLPGGFEERTKGRGLIIRGWAPQAVILDHEAIGAFVTHCGWNSTLEGISAGVPMVTWPGFAEQFYNEKLVTQILRIGVSIEVKKWNRNPLVEDVIRRDAIEKAVREIMEGEKAEEIRLRAKELKEKAWKAVAVGGSSYVGLSELINDLRSYHTQS